MNKIIKEQWGDQALHFVLGAAATPGLCKFLGAWLAAIIMVIVWLAWEHSQYPQHDSKGYDDSTLDRAFQEAGILAGLSLWLV